MFKEWKIQYILLHAVIFKTILLLIFGIIARMKICQFSITCIIWMGSITSILSIHYFNPSYISVENLKTVCSCFVFYFHAQFTGNENQSLERLHACFVCGNGTDRYQPIEHESNKTMFAVASWKVVSFFSWKYTTHLSNIEGLLVDQWLAFTDCHLPSKILEYLDWNN